MLYIPERIKVFLGGGGLQRDNTYTYRQHLYIIVYTKYSWSSINRFTVPPTEYIEWQCPLSGIHSIMMENQPNPWWGWGMHTIPLSLYVPSQAKLWSTLQLRGQIHSPYFSSTLICTLWSQLQHLPLMSVSWLLAALCLVTSDSTGIRNGLYLLLHSTLAYWHSV